MFSRRNRHVRDNHVQTLCHSAKLSLNVAHCPGSRVAAAALYTACRLLPRRCPVPRAGRGGSSAEGSRGGRDATSRGSVARFVATCDCSTQSLLIKFTIHMHSQVYEYALYDTCMQPYRCQWRLPLPPAASIPPPRPCTRRRKAPSACWDASTATLAPRLAAAAASLTTPCSVFDTPCSSLGSKCVSLRHK